MKIIVKFNGGANTAIKVSKWLREQEILFGYDYTWFLNEPEAVFTVEELRTAVLISLKFSYLLPAYQTEVKL